MGATYPTAARVGWSERQRTPTGCGSGVLEFAALTPTYIYFAQVDGNLDICGDPRTYSPTNAKTSFNTRLDKYIPERLKESKRGLAFGI